MDEEIKAFREAFDFKQKNITENFYYYEGSFGGNQLRLAKSGIGKVQAALTTSYLIAEKKPDLILNTGTSGAISPDIHRFDCIVGTGAFYHDVNLTAFGRPLGQIPGHDVIFKADTNVKDELIEISKELYAKHTKTGLIATGDQFIGSDEAKSAIIKNFPETVCAEMEGAAIAQVCDEFKIPFGEVRTVSDDTPEDSADQFDSGVDDAGLMAANIVIKYLKG